MAYPNKVVVKAMNATIRTAEIPDGCTDREIVEAVMETFEAMLHLAAATHRTNELDRKARKKNGVS